LKIAVVGGGLSGLEAAFDLLEPGRRIEVDLFEKNDYLGGMASYLLLDNERITRTYHHVIPTDRTLVNVFERFRIPIEWRRVSVGFFSNNRIYDFNGPFDLIRFKPLSLLERLRLGFLVLTAKNSEDLNDMTVQDWVSKKAGVGTFEKFVDPLVSSYFGTAKELSASYLAERWSSESRSAINRLGLADFPTLVDAYEAAIQQRGGDILTKKAVTRIELERDQVILECGEKRSYDAVILTCAPRQSAELVVSNQDRSVDRLKEELSNVKYRCCICGLFEVREKLSKYYWLNIMNGGMPFIACFEYDNLNTSFGRNIVYAVSYVDSNSPLWKAGEKEVAEKFQIGLETIFSNVEVLTYNIHREEYGTPFYHVGYKNIGLNPLKGVYFAGIYRKFPRIRSSGPAILSGQEAAEKAVRDMEENTVGQ